MSDQTTADSNVFTTRKRPRGNMRKKTETIEKDNVNPTPETEEQKEEDEELRIFKKQKTKNSVISATSKDLKKGAEDAVNFSFKSSQSAVPAGSSDQHATAESNIDGDEIKGESGAEGYIGLKSYALAGKRETTSRFGPRKSFVITILKIILNHVRINRTGIVAHKSDSTDGLPARFVQRLQGDWLLRLRRQLQVYA